MGFSFNGFLGIGGFINVVCKDGFGRTFQGEVFWLESLCQ